MFPVTYIMTIFLCSLVYIRLLRTLSLEADFHRGPPLVAFCLSPLDVCSSSRLQQVDGTECIYINTS
jgi:hypothetical protein